MPPLDTAVCDRTPGLRIAYCVAPAIGGTFAFYRNLAAATREHGCTVFAVSIGADDARRWDDRFACDGCVRIAHEENDPRRAAAELAKWCDRHEVDILIPMCGPVACSAVPHLPSRVRVITRTTNLTRHTYHLVTLHPDHVCRLVATSPRLRDDLVAHHATSPDKITLIPNGVDLDRFGAPADARQDDLEIAYIGRIENQSKATHLLPPILAALRRRGIPHRLHVVGAGPDAPALEKALSEQRDAGRVAMHGPLPAESVAALLSKIQVFVMPSFYEGCPNMLLEAMAAGAAPVVTRIRGVTDWVLGESDAGMLCEPGKVDAFADAIQALHEDRPRLVAMRHASREAAIQRFGLAEMGRRYAAVFGQAIACEARQPVSWDAFQIHPAFRGSWRAWVPRRVKTWFHAARAH